MPRTEEFHCPLCGKTVDECEGHDPEEYGDYPEGSL